ncbi:MAG: putative protein N(5)-glutamine methyltransferase [Rhodoglobus sp.]
MTEDIVRRLRAAGCVFAEDEAALLIAEATSEAHLEQLVAARVSGLPLEHVLGWVEFCGDRYRIGPDVFVPRPRSVALVREAVSIAAPSATILDLCCGCGAVGIAVSRRVSGSRLYSADLDPRATVWARLNGAPYGAEVFDSDLFDSVPAHLRGELDLITVVAPYVPTDQIPLLPHEARDFEPTLALDGGADGLEILHRIIREAPQWLRAGGHLVTEIAEEQVPSISVDERWTVRVNTDDDGATVAVFTLRGPTPEG